MKARSPLLAISSMAALALSLGACSGGGTTPSENSPAPRSPDSSPTTDGAQPMSASPSAMESPTGSVPSGGGNVQPSSEVTDKILVGERAGFTLVAAPEGSDIGISQPGSEVEPAGCNLTDMPRPLAASIGLSDTLVGQVTLAEGSFAAMFKDHVTRCPTVKATWGSITTDLTQEVTEAAVDGAEEVYAVTHVSVSTLTDQQVTQRSHHLVGVVSGTSIVIRVTGLDGSIPPDPEVARQLFEAQRDLLA
ncbi:hypothetical protein EII34_11125 [Arachnia propionica]|uniref:Uncharacterized protein n=1 Tax=Arachnia propionica TaxID=1750 RepID=A0A3P1T3U9_9ACTN|nr:hypothetical protein [Arachnia propionica]RRD04151.1 hypothetical protein EII34_11125 [Arachnia propionica]